MRVSTISMNVSMSVYIYETLREYYDCECECLYLNDECEYVTKNIQCECECTHNTYDRILSVTHHTNLTHTPPRCLPHAHL